MPATCPFCSGRTDEEPGQFCSVGPEDTRANMIVVKFTFGVNRLDTVEIFRNPTSRDDEAAAKVTATLHGDFRFDRIALARFVGNVPTHAIDELRFKTQYSDAFSPCDEATQEAARMRAASRASHKADAFRQRSAALNVKEVEVAHYLSQLDEIISASDLSPWDELASIDALCAQLELTVLGQQFDRLLFVKRHAYQPSHIYTEYSDGPYRPGGGISVLALVSPQGTCTRMRR